MVRRLTMGLRLATLVVLLCGPAHGAPLVLEGEVPEDGGVFFTVPFLVPSRTVELEVRHDDLSSSNVLDFGLLAPGNDFRGWGGGNPEPAIVGRDAASRSYLAGPLPAGQWQVLIGKALIVSRPARYRLEIDARTTATLRAQERTPWAPPAPLERTRRWYAGDLHVHSLESGDARPSLDEIATFARSRRLDFVAVSDHNTSSHLDFLRAAQARHPSLLLVPSVEFTTTRGHLNAFGASRFVPFWLGFDGVTLQGALQAYDQQNAIATINHPTLDLGTFCIGCAWELPVVPELMKAIEIGVGGWDETGSLFDESAIALWESLADKGVHLAAVGGSDDHRAGVARSQTQSPLGSPTTLLLADELSVVALTSALREGRSVVKLRGPDDPMIELSAVEPLPRAGDTLVGASVTVEATVTGATGAVLVWIRNGVVAREESIGDDRWTSTFSLEAPVGRSARLRAEVRRGGVPSTVTSHLWLSPDAPPGPPVVESRETRASCQGCSADGGVLGLLLFATRRRRTRT